MPSAETVPSAANGDMRLRWHFQRPAVAHQRTAVDAQRPVLIDFNGAVTGVPFISVLGGYSQPAVLRQRDIEAAPRYG